MAGSQAEWDVQFVIPDCWDAGIESDCRLGTYPQVCLKQENWRPKIRADLANPQQGREELTKACSGPYRKTRSSTLDLVVTLTATATYVSACGVQRSPYWCVMYLTVCLESSKSSSFRLILQHTRRRFKSVGAYLPIL